MLAETCADNTLCDPAAETPAFPTNQRGRAEAPSKHASVMCANRIARTSVSAMRSILLQSLVYNRRLQLSSLHFFVISAFGHHLKKNQASLVSTTFVGVTLCYSHNCAITVVNVAVCILALVFSIIVKTSLVDWHSNECTGKSVTCFLITIFYLECR